jgi:DMSO/TMAO reductase YedYZ molybdopterin-dependent catalytic subunit
VSDSEDENAIAEANRKVALAMRVRSRRDFLALGSGAVAAVAGWHWLRTRPRIGGVPAPLRRTLELNERLAEQYFESGRLAPTFNRELAREPRVNGDEGMKGAFDPNSWRLRVTAPNVEYALTLDDVRRLPRNEMTIDFKCIEGWSVIVNWAGARLADFAQAYRLATRDGSLADVRNRPDALRRYVGLETPNGEYYVGLDIASALHPQTLLCYEMNGAPLSIGHGGPLRLVTPVKYGIKSIKRIGRIEFSDNRPRDFWAERGYDWYLGH